ncbi:hypothetical protein ES705_33671 [subsurface metagenome]
MRHDRFIYPMNYIRYLILLRTNDEIVVTQQSLCKKELSNILQLRWEELSERLLLISEVQQSDKIKISSITIRIREILHFFNGILELNNKNLNEIKEILVIIDQRDVRNQWIVVEKMMGRIYTKIMEL